MICVAAISHTFVAPLRILQTRGEETQTERTVLSRWPLILLSHDGLHILSAQSETPMGEDREVFLTDTLLVQGFTVTLCVGEERQPHSCQTFKSQMIRGRRAAAVVVFAVLNVSVLPCTKKPSSSPQSRFLFPEHRQKTNDNKNRQNGNQITFLKESLSVQMDILCTLSEFWSEGRVWFHGRKDTAALVSFSIEKGAQIY